MSAVRGEMLWFNVEKGYGFIQTEDDERLYVEETGFLPGEVPVGRCKGQSVAFELQGADGDRRAVDVHFVEDPDPPRARLRRPRGGTSL